MRWSWPLVLALPLAAAFALPGCVDCSSGPPVTARGIGEGEPVSAGDGPFTLRVRVTDEPGGPALPGAGVVVWWADDDPRETDPDERAGPDGEVVEPDHEVATPRPETALRLATGPDGVATARVPAHRFVGVVAAKDGFTEEWVAHVATGASGGETFQLVPLYREQVTVELQGTWGPGGATTAWATGGGHLWLPQQAPFGEREARSGYAARLVEMKAELVWENTATSFGDLAIGAGPDNADGPRLVESTSNNVGPGEKSESVVWDAHALQEAGLVGASATYIGPASDTLYAGPLGGLPYKLVVTARFDRAQADTDGCVYVGARDDDSGEGVSSPGAGIVVAAGVLALAAVAREASMRGRSRVKQDQRSPA